MLLAEGQIGSRLDMARFIPQPDYRVGQVVFIAQRADARSAQQGAPAMRPVRSLERPLPICDVRRIYAELVGVIFTRDLLVE